MHLEGCRNNLIIVHLLFAMRELQRTIDAVKVPTLGIATAIQAYQDSIAPLTTAVQNINNLYAPILEQTRMFENIYNKSMMAALQSSIPAMEVMADINPTSDITISKINW